MERNLKVEKAVLATLNRLMADEGITLRDDRFINDEHSVAFSAHLPNREECVHIVTLWAEWPDTYIFFLGGDRGMYLRWIEDGERLLISLTTEMTDPPDYSDSEYAHLFHQFILIQRRLASEAIYRFHKLSTSNH